MKRLRAWWTLREESCDCPQQDALEVLCRVFDDDDAHQEYLEWYKPTEWLHPSRALGAFVRSRLSRAPEYKRGWDAGHAAAVRRMKRGIEKIWGAPNVPPESMKETG